MPEPSARIQNLVDDGRAIVDILRLDQVDPVTGGNKWFKLKHNLLAAKAQRKSTIVTAGGASSNHIAAAAEACRRAGLKSIGIIRGGETETHTMRYARAAGMKLMPVGRKDFSEGLANGFKTITGISGDDFFYVPEGGNNCDGMKGCIEMTEGCGQYDVVLCACGTGTTFAGLVAAGEQRVVVGISVLKGNNTLPAQVKELIRRCSGQEVHVSGNEGLENGITTHCITNACAFSGYARADGQVIDFKNDFERRYHIPLDYIYTARLMFAANELLEKGMLDGKKVLVIHSGGLQGNRDFEERYHLMPTR